MKDHIKVIVTRTGVPGQRLTGEIKELGFDAVHLPSMVIEQIDNPYFKIISKIPGSRIKTLGGSSSEQKCDSADHVRDDSIRDKDGRIDCIIFISPNAVRYGRDILKNHHGVIAAIGPGTARALREIGLEPDLMPDGRYDSEGLLALDYFNDINNKKIIIVRGEGGREYLSQELIKLGASVAYCEVYKRLLPEYTKEQVQQYLEADLIIATSIETIDNIMRLVGGVEKLFSVDWLVSSQRIANHARSLGFNSTITLAKDATAESLLEVVTRL